MAEENTVRYRILNKLPPAIKTNYAHRFSEILLRILGYNFKIVRGHLSTCFLFPISYMNHQ